MNDSEKIDCFGDMVRASERLVRPWRWALIITNCLWAIAFILIYWILPL